MSLLSKFTVTPLLYAIGALLLVIAGMGVRMHMLKADRDTYNAIATAASAQLDAAQTERQAWKDRAGALAEASRTCDSSIESLTVTLDRQQKSFRAQLAANGKAVAAARADAADADAALKRFVGQFAAESRRPSCAAALAALDSVCPALEDY